MARAILEVDDVLTLEVGDQVETESLFPGLGNLPTVLHVTDVIGENTKVKFDVRYSGIHLAFWEVAIIKDKVVWTV